MVFGITTIVLLILVSGAIAFIGDRLGSRVGKYKLTIFSLRPKHTAILVTVVSGIFIAIFTLGTLLMISQDAKTALFGLEKLKKDISLYQGKLENTKDKLDKTEMELAQKRMELEESKTKLKEAQTEISRLASVKRSLEKEIKATRKGKFLYSVNEVILVTLVKGDSDSKKVKENLQKIVTVMNNYLQRYSGKKNNVEVRNLNEVVSKLAGNSYEHVLRIIVDKNVLYGEKVPVHFEVVRNDLIYKKDQMIAHRKIDSNLSSAEIEQQLKEILSKVHELAKNKGIIPDVSGSIGIISYSQIFDAAKTIKLETGNVEVKVIAARDIARIGPLEVKFEL